MRILMVCPFRSLVGGVEKYLQTAIQGLLDRGHEIGLLYEHRYDPQWEPIDPPQARIPMWCLSEENAATIVRSIREWGPDTAYFHGLEGADAVTMEDALLASYPVILFLHTHDRTCATGRKFYSFPQPEPCGRRMGPLCLLLHYPRGCGGLHPGTMWRRYQRNRTLHSRLGAHQAVLVASASMYAELQQHGVKSQKLHLVPLPTTDILPQDAAPLPKLPAGRILFLGRLTDLKGAHYLIQALPKAAQQLRSPLNLTIVGDGPDRSKLQALADRLNVAVKFVGWADAATRAELIRQADLLAVPSLSETFGLVGIEAGCLGLPAVGYAVGGIPDWLVPGESGELAPSNPPTPDGLADAIARALQSTTHYNRLCVGAWKMAQRFTLHDHLNRLEAVFSTAVVSPRAVVLPVLQTW